MAQELRYALRALRRNPLFTLVAVLTVALGVGANTAMFSLVYGVLLRPLAYPNASRIVQLNTSFIQQRRTIPRLTGPDVVDIRADASTLAQVSFYNGGELGVQLAHGAEFVGTYLVTPNFLSVFGVSPAFGRDLTIDDAQRGAIVSLSFAQRHFGSGAQALGQRLRMEGVAYDIVGITPASFGFPRGAHVWLAVSPQPSSMERTAYNYRAVALLGPDHSIDTANAQLATIAARLQTEYPVANRNKAFVAALLQEQLVGPVRTTLYFLMGAVSVVLLIACANVANLLLARATTRQRELAVRAAIGASRAALARHMIAESGLLAVAGGTLGLLLAIAGVRTLALTTAQQFGLPRLEDVDVNGSVLTFATAASLITCVLFGVSPAWQAAQVDVNVTLKQAGRGLFGSSGRLRHALVVVQVALSFALAIGAGLLVRSFLTLSAVDLGFRSDSMLVVKAHEPARTLDDYLRAGRMFESAVERLTLVNGITSAAAAMGVPTGQYGSNGGYAVDGQDFRGRLGPVAQAKFTLAGPGYFRTMGVRLSSGRDFTAGDRYDRQPVAIISESLARQSFPGHDPIGHTILCGLDSSPKWMTIVGIVADTRQDSPASSLGPTLYMPLLQHPYHGNELHVLLRTNVPPESLTDEVSSAMRSLSPQVAMTFTTLDTMVSDSIATPRMRTMLASLFAGLALLLAMTGMYGVMSYIALERVPEFAVRMALGATSGHVLALVLGRAGQMAALGIVGGVALALSATRIVESMLFGVTVSDATTYAAVLLAAIPLIVLAAAIPAWRATRVEPVTVLRNS